MTEQNNTFIAKDDKQYDEAIFYLVKRVVQLTTKVKTAVIGKSINYYNYEDEIIAKTPLGKREIELTDKTDEETRSGLISILGAGQ
jgi:hypothetical protein